jgi:hypothetical protein
MNDPITASQTDFSAYPPHWEPVNDWGTAQGGEFLWARACRRVTTTTLTLSIATLFYLLRFGDQIGTDPIWRMQVMMVCGLLLLCCLAPSLLRAYYHYRFGRSVISEAGNAIPWL